MTELTFGTLVGYLLGLLIVFVIAKIFLAPIKIVLRLLVNSAVAIGVLFLINLMEPFLNIHIGINAISALIVGILGIPGLCLMMLLQVIF